MKSIKVFTMKFITLVAILLMPVLVWGKSISVATNQWQPYINTQNQPFGSAADILNQVLSQDKLNIKWQYQNYDLALELVAKGKQQAAFPYFKTPEREEKVLFSKPIFSVTSHIYYNRQGATHLDFTTLSAYKFGRVAGYSYGQEIDTYLSDAKVFSNEKEALESLFKNEIDFLPMTESVMNNMLNSTYTDQALLIKKIDELSSNDTLHLIAPNNSAGASLIDKINILLKQVEGIESLKSKPLKRFQPKDIAKLVTAEGYPAIVGQVSLDKATDYYTLPQGTRVLILSWSDKILNPSSTDRIYKSMIDLSHVVVLNGPHVGKELYIKNMHLEVQ